MSTPYPLQSRTSRCSRAEECPAGLKRSHHDVSLHLRMTTILVSRGPRTLGGGHSALLWPISGRIWKRTWAQVEDMRLIPFTESKRGLYQAPLDLLRIRQLTLTSAAFQLINTTNKKGGKNKARVGEKKRFSLWQRLIHLSGGTHPWRPQLAYYHPSNVESS